MNNAELDRLLKTALPPERAAEQLEQFPKQVIAEIQSREQRRVASAARNAGLGTGVFPTRARVRFWRPAFRIGFAVICVALVFVLGYGLSKRQRGAAGDHTLAEAQRYFQEIASLFPNQVQAIVFGPQGPRLLLADKANVPSSPPLYVKICGPKGCQQFVTFSGQQIRFNGDFLDVLVDHQGKVLVMGAQWVWSSSQPAAQASPYRIEARPLPTTS